MIAPVWVAVIVTVASPDALTDMAGLRPVEERLSLFVPVVTSSITTPTTVFATVRSSATPPVEMVVVQTSVSPCVTVIGIVAGMISMLVAICYGFLIITFRFGRLK